MEGKAGMTSTGRGTCKLCNRSCAHGRMSRHIRKHLDEGGGAEASRTAEGCFIINVSDSDGTFWMFLEIAGRRKLSDLDGFLRKEWMECCGHLSSFYIGGEEYCSNRQVAGAKSMGSRLDKAICEETEFQYEYDFGCSTPLRLKVVATGVPAFSRTQSKVTVLARHDMVTFNCSVCGSKADHICPDCGMWGGGVLCDRCVRKHKCGMDIVLPAVQSPRVGMCGYAGKEPDDRAGWTYTGNK